MLLRDLCFSRHFDTVVIPPGVVSQVDDGGRTHRLAVRDVACEPPEVRLRWLEGRFLYMIQDVYIYDFQMYTVYIYRC